jgi:hypothetical protein
MGINRTATINIAAANAAGIAPSQSIAAGAAATLTATPFVLDAPRRVIADPIALPHLKLAPP